MNAGLGNLTTLKAILLPLAMRANDEWDTAILALAQGVAAQFENHLNRQLAFVVGDTFDCPANRAYVSLPRYPLLEILAIDERDTADGDWVSLGTPSEAALNYSESAGLVEFGFITAPYFSRIRVTYTGGYFFETLEPTDDGYPTAPPAGAARLPADIAHAWHLQCEAEIKKTDLLRGGAATRKEDKTPDLNDLRLLPAVVALLRPFVRYAS